MFSHKLASIALVVIALNAAAAVQQQERVIAGGPNDSMEVRYLVLRGTNEEIGRALAEIARARFGVKPDRSADPLRIRAQRRYIETAYPILYDRMRGVAAAFGQRVDDDAYQHAELGFTELRAGCSIVHLPPASTADHRGVVSRDYDFSTGSLSFGFLAPGMLHPTARPYLIEMHPDRGYASIAMTAYELLSGTLDGMNSEGLTVTMAMDDEMFSQKKIEPVLAAAPGLGELQTMRLLLDTCATVDEAKEALLRTKQYYAFVPVHYLIADRFGRSFVWEYSEFHNKEYIIESPGRPLVLTNFTLNKHMDGNNPPTPDLARAVCKRYAFLSDRLAGGTITEEMLRATHSKVDAQAPPDASRPPVRTFWHALYYPEERRVKYSYYLHDDEKARPVRGEYLEFRLEPTNVGRPDVKPVLNASPAAPAAAAPRPASSEEQAIAKLKAAGVTVQIEDGHAVAVGFAKDSEPAPLLPLLRELPRLHLVGFAGTKIADDDLKLLTPITRIDFVGLRDTAVTDAGLSHLAPLTGITGLNLAGTKVTDAGLVHLKGMSRLTKLNLTNTAVTDQGVAEAKKFLPFWAMIQR
jgi:hypothetical protein